MDIAVLTEVNDRFLVGGQQAVAYSTPGKPPYMPNEHAVGIWTGLPVRSVLNVRDERLACCIELETPLGPTLVYATILPYKNEGASDGAATWAEHRRTLVLQLQDWRELRATKPSHHLIVAGDFNMTMEPCNNYVDKESRAMLLGAMQQLNVRCVTDDDCRLDIGRANIDHVLISNGLRVSSPTQYCMAETERYGIPRPLSDHNAVTVSVF